MFKRVYKIVKTPHVRIENVGENESKWEWSHEVYLKEYFFWIPSSWQFKDKFVGRQDAIDYIEYQLSPSYYS